MDEVRCYGPERPATRRAVAHARRDRQVSRSANQSGIGQETPVCEPQHQDNYNQRRLKQHEVTQQPSLAPSRIQDVANAGVDVRRLRRQLDQASHHQHHDRRDRDTQADALES